MENIGIKLKNKRKSKGLTQEQMADSLCITQKNYSYYETGKTIPGIPILEKIAEIFGMSLKELLFEEVSAPPPQDKNND